MTLILLHLIYNFSSMQCRNRIPLYSTLLYGKEEGGGGGGGGTINAG